MQDFYKYENKEDFFQANDGYLDLEEKATQAMFTERHLSDQMFDDDEP